MILDYSLYSMFKSYVLVCLGISAVFSIRDELLAIGIGSSLNMTEAENSFVETYSMLHRQFDYDSYNKLSADFMEGLKAIGDSKVFKGDDSVPHCDVGSSGRVVTSLANTHIAPLYHFYCNVLRFYITYYIPFCLVLVDLHVELMVLIC